MTVVPGAKPRGPIDCWLVSDEKAELIGKIRALAKTLGTEARVSDFAYTGFRIEPLPVMHTSHPTFGYLLKAKGLTVVWAPEFIEFRVGPKAPSHVPLLTGCRGAAFQSATSA